MAAVLYWTNPAGAFYVGLMILAGAGVYFSVLVLLKGFGKESFVVIDDSEVADEVELMNLFKEFGEAYDLKILYPSTAFISVNEFVEALFDKTFQYP